jgi:hypothetical protein
LDKEYDVQVVIDDLPQQDEVISENDLGQLSAVRFEQINIHGNTHSTFPHRCSTRKYGMFIMLEGFGVHADLLLPTYLPHQYS